MRISDWSSDVCSSDLRRRPACEIDPESDLGALAVTVAVGALTPTEVAVALRHGCAEAEAMQKAGLIEAAVLFLHGQVEVVDGERHSLLLSPSGLVPEGPCCRSARLLQGRQEPASGMDCRDKPGNDSLGMTIGYREAATRAV